MIDYLFGLAQQAANPSDTVRPSVRPLFADRPGDTADSQVDDSSSIDEFVNVESPADWNEGRTSRTADEEGEVSNSGLKTPSASERSAFTQILERPGETDGSSARAAANEFAEPNASRSSLPRSRQQPDAPVRPLAAVESNLAQRPALPNLVDDRRQETSSPQTGSEESDVRRDQLTSSKPGLPVNPRPSDEGTLKSPPHVKSVLSERQDLSRGLVNPVVEIRSERESGLPSLRPQISERTKEIIPLSATTPLPPQLFRSQPVSSPVVQPAAETIVHVTIGRVEVRATVGRQKPVAAREPSSRQSSQSLEDYLRGGSSGRPS